MLISVNFNKKEKSYEGEALDLVDPFGGDPPVLPDVGQLGLAAVEEAVAAPHHVGGAVVEGGEHPVEAGALDI